MADTVIEETLKKLKQFESSNGTNTKLEKIGNTVGNYHITPSNIRKLRKDLKGKSDKEIHQFILKNPKEEENIARDFITPMQDKVKDLKPHEQVGMISAAYNIKGGMQRMKDNNILKDLREGRVKKASAQLKRFKYAGKEVISGLETRRAAEASLLNNEDKELSDRFQKVQEQIDKESSPLASSLQDQVKEASKPIETSNVDGKSLIQVGDTDMNQDEEGIRKPSLRDKIKKASAAIGNTEVEQAPFQPTLTREGSFSVGNEIAQRIQNNPRPVTEKQEVIARRKVESTEKAQESAEDQAIQGADILTKATPDQVNKAIDEKMIDSPEADKAEVKQEFKNRREGNKGTGPASQFADALTFFLPQMIGGLLGGAIGGTDGLVEGVDRSGVARDAFLKNDRENRKLDIAEGKSSSAGNKPDFKTFVDKDGKPIVKRGNAFEDLSGNILNPSDVRQATTFRQTRSLEQRASETGDRQDRFDRKFTLDKAKAAGLSGKQIEQRSSMTNVLSSINRITFLKKGVDTGVFANGWGNLTEYFDAQPEGFTELKSETNDSLAKYVKALSGAQVSEQEAIRLGAIMPKTTDNDDTFKRKLRVFRTIMESNQAAFDDAIMTGQPLRAESIKGLIEAEAEFLSGEGKKKDSSDTGNNSSSIKESYNEEKLKRFEAYKANRNK